MYTHLTLKPFVIDFDLLKPFVIDFDLFEPFMISIIYDVGVASILINNSGVIYLYI